MSDIKAQVLAADKPDAQDFGVRGALPMPPGRSFAILTYMAARLNSAKYAGVAERDAHVIRNADGHASDDAIRSLVISHKSLGTKEWFDIHHTNCGMEIFDDETMHGLLAKSLATAVLDETGWKDVGWEPGSRDGDYVDWPIIGDLAQSVREDVVQIRNHPLVSKSIAVLGFIYDVASGELNEVQA